MDKLNDSNLADGAAPFYPVWCWNGEHTKRKIFKNCTTLKEAEDYVKALRSHGIEAEYVPVGADGKPKT